MKATTRWERAGGGRKSSNSGGTRRDVGPQVHSWDVLTARTLSYGSKIKLQRQEEQLDPWGIRFAQDQTDENTNYEHNVRRENA